jgi:hypothetical protein
MICNEKISHKPISGKCPSNKYQIKSDDEIKISFFVKLFYLFLIEKIMK